MGTSRRCLLSLGVTGIGEVRYLSGLMCSNFKCPKLGEERLLQCGCSVCLSSYCALTHPPQIRAKPFFHVTQESNKASFGLPTEGPNTVL